MSAASLNLRPETYPEILNALEKVHSEAKIEQPGCGEGMLGSRVYLRLRSNSEGIRQSLLDEAPQKVSELLIKLLPFSAHSLMIYEAAHRIGNEKIANRIFRDWNAAFAQEIEAVVRKEQIDRIKAETYLPIFASRDRVEKLLANQPPVALSILLDRLPITAKEKYPDLIQQAEERIQKETIQKPKSIEHQLLVGRYQHRVIELSLQGWSEVDNSVIQYLLETFPNLSRLDAAGCERITPVAFAKGHRNLHTLILDATPIQPEMIPLGLFPLLECRVNRKPIRLIFMDEEFNRLTKEDSSWAELEMKLDTGKQIPPSDPKIYKGVFELAKSYPSLPKFRLINRLYDSGWPDYLQRGYIRFMIDFHLLTKEKEVLTVLLHLEKENKLADLFHYHLNQFREGKILFGRLEEVAEKFRQLGLGKTRKIVDHELSQTRSTNFLPKA